MATCPTESYTKGNLRNNCEETLSLCQRRPKIWIGSATVVFQDKILPKDEAHFTHRGNSEGSKGAAVYKLPNETKWVVAWSNLKNKSNKVYTNIAQQPVTWEDIGTNLDARGEQKYSVTEF